MIDKSKYQREIIWLGNQLSGSRQPSWTLQGTSSGCNTGREGRRSSSWQTEPGKELSLPALNGRGTRSRPASRRTGATCNPTSTATRAPSSPHRRLDFLVTERIIFRPGSPPSSGALWTRSGYLETWSLAPTHSPSGYPCTFSSRDNESSDCCPAKYQQCLLTVLHSPMITPDKSWVNNPGVA